MVYFIGRNQIERKLLGGGYKIIVAAVVIVVLGNFKKILYNSLSF